MSTHDELSWTRLIVHLPTPLSLQNLNGDAFVNAANNLINQAYENAYKTDPSTMLMEITTPTIYRPKHRKKFNPR